MDFDPAQADPDLKRLLEVDKRLFAIAIQFKILSMIEWPKTKQDEFLTAYNRGEKIIPHVDYPQRQHSEQLKALDEIMAATTAQQPLAQYLNQTARSYWLGHKFAENLGKPEMLNYSIELYGRPGDLVSGSKYSNIDAARFFIEIADEFNDYHNVDEQDLCVLAETIKGQLEKEIAAVFTEDKVAVQVDEKLVPKAAAGFNRVRLRSGTCFSPYDFKQLLEHEIFVHTLTAINGKYQKHLTCLGAGSPRTTATQEGLATFAELITGAIDLGRLKRIALRVLAVNMALDGANFIEVFEFFLKNGQSQHESFSSAQRIFRGGDPNGRYVFTKDSVYLDGLLRAHSFFRWAMKKKKLWLTRILFSGRMTFDDAEKLAPLYDAGVILPPKYLPPWLSQVPTLGGYLAFSLFANKIRVGTLDKEFSATQKPSD